MATTLPQFLDLFHECDISIVGHPLVSGLGGRYAADGDSQGVSWRQNQLSFELNRLETVLNQSSGARQRMAVWSGFRRESPLRLPLGSKQKSARFRLQLENLPVGVDPLAITGPV